MAQTSFELVAEWFGKAARNARAKGRGDSARLWEDGLEHLIELNERCSDLMETLEYILKTNELSTNAENKAKDAIRKARGAGI